MDGLKEERKIWGQELAQQGGRPDEKDWTRVTRFKQQDLSKFIISELPLYNIHCFIDSIQETLNLVSSVEIMVILGVPE